MKDTKTQEPRLTPGWLTSKGYTIAAAARRIKRSHNHVSQVLHGKRQSAKVEAALRALPWRDWTPRERIR